MPKKSTYKRGQHNVIDDIDGQKYKSSEMVKNWKNQLVNKVRNFEPKQPQLTIRPRQEKISVQNTRTQAPDPPLQDPPITSGQIV